MWFNQRNDTGNALLPLWSIFNTNWMGFGVFLGQPCPQPVQCPEWVELKPNKGTQVATYQGLELRAWIISTWSRDFRLLTHSRTQIRARSNAGKRGKENVLALAKYIKQFCRQEIPIRWSLSQIWRFSGIISQQHYGQDFNIWGGLLRILNSDRSFTSFSVSQNKTLDDNLKFWCISGKFIKMINLCIYSPDKAKVF